MLFNDINLAPFLTIKAVRGRGIIQNEISSRAVPNRDGSFFRRKRRPSRILEVDCMIAGDTPEELRDTIDELNGILAVEKEVPIVFEDETNKTYYGIPAFSRENGELIASSNTTLVFHCSNPNKFGPTKNVTGEVVTVGSTAPTPPVLTLTMQATAEALSLALEDEILTLHYGFTAGDKVKIDCEHRKVYLNGDLNMEIVDLTMADFFLLKKGENHILVSPTAPLEVSYRERWY